MAEVILDRLSASNIFDLRGVVAVVTGGGTVRSYIFPAAVHPVYSVFLCYRYRELD